MSIGFVEAAQLASWGAKDVVPGYSPRSQTMNNSMVMLKPDRRVPAAPMQRSIPREQARYRLLQKLSRQEPRTVAQAPSTTIGGRAAQVLRQGEMINRFRFSGSVVRRMQARQDTVIAAATRRPDLMAKVDPDGSLQKAWNPSKPHPRRPQKRLVQGAMQVAKFVPLRQLPQLVPV